MAAPDRTAAGGHTDIRADDWIARRAPGFARPYLRIARADRPIGWWLLLWPCWWSVAMASEAWPSPWLMALFLVGAVVMRAAGCCWNDIADRDFDGRVERTRTRPIPAGDLTVLQAGLFMVLLALVGLAVLLSFNRFAILVGVVSLAPVAIYPFMKRVTWWPQFFLGIAFNWGALLGWAAVRGSLEWPALLLYLGGIAWTLGYDTIYAHQDKEDDALLGLKSSAIHLGRGPAPRFGFFTASPGSASPPPAIWRASPGRSGSVSPSPSANLPGRRRGSPRTTPPTAWPSSSPTRSLAGCSSPRSWRGGSSVRDPVVAQDFFLEDEAVAGAFRRGQAATLGQHRLDPEVVEEIEVFGQMSVRDRGQ